MKECISLISECETCIERYECDIYKASVGFGKYNKDSIKVKRKMKYNLDFYERGMNIDRNVGEYM